MAGKPGMHKERAGYRFGAEYQDKLRAKIKTGMMLSALADHVVGKREMTSTQVTAALGLLRKAMPDLAATEMTGSVTTYQDTLRRVAETMGWATAAAQVASEPVDNTVDNDSGAVHTTNNTEDATSAGS